MWAYYTYLPNNTNLILILILHGLVYVTGSLKKKNTNLCRKWVYLGVYVLKSNIDEKFCKFGNIMRSSHKKQNIVEKLKSQSPKCQQKF